MTAKEIAMIVGREGQYVVNGLTIDVVVLDVKPAYGRLLYLVEPKAGEGKIWVQADKVKMVEKAK